MTTFLTARGLRARMAAGLCLLAVACGDDGAPAIECGEGTVLEDDQCVAEAEPDAGSKPDDKPDSGKTSSVTCGAGTIESDGKCVVDPKAKLECGDGTEAKDGKCVVPPPPGKKIESLRVSQLSLRSNGELLKDNSEIRMFYPVEVSVGLKYKGDAAKIPVVIAFGEKPDPNNEQAEKGFCLVGGFSIDHPGGTTEVESIATATLDIPKGCLTGTESSRTVSPIVMIDPDRTVGALDQDAVSRDVAFLKANETDPDIAECRVDAALATKGNCRIEVQMKPSSGLDFELKELTAESAVVVLDKCAAGVDQDRPASYRCNSSIVPEFKIKRNNAGVAELDANGGTQVLLDGDGKPIQETYDDNGTQKPKFVYGAADLALDVTVITYGEDDSKLKNADEAEDIEPANEEDAVNDVLEDHGLQIRYQIRAAGSQDDGDWLPLYLHKQGEQAKAGEEGVSGQDQTQFEETEAVPLAPHYYSHGLYVENDCGERNQATCNTNLKTRDDIVSGDLSSTSSFVVRACLVPVDDSGNDDQGFDSDSSNNCKELPVHIVRHDTSAAPTTASSYAWNYQWADGAGSQSTLRLGWAFHTWNKVDTGGASTDNEGAITLGSNLIGYADILKGWAKGAAYVSLVGSYYDYGLSTFGVKVWGDAQTVPEFHWEKDWNVTKTLSRSTIIWAGPVPIELEISLTGMAGVVVNVDIVGVTAPLNPDEESESFLVGKTGGASKIGLAQLAVTPYGSMVAQAKAAVTAGVARAGVAGELTLLTMRVPATGRLWWGVTSLSPFQLKLGAWADLKLTLTAMAGRLYLFAENYAVDWCTKKIKVGFIKVKVSYPCGASWNTFWDYTIASWSGWTWNQTLWTSPYLEYAIP